jgi:hypothetical protein
MAGQFFPDGFFHPHQNHANAKLPRSEHRTFDFGARRRISSHGVESNCDHLEHPIRQVGPEKT